MSTLKQRLSDANVLLSKTYETTITYAVVCRKTDTYNNAIELFDSLKDAQNCIKGIQETTMDEEGWKNRLYILPVVVDNDSYEEVTKENMSYYDLQSEWVINLKKEQEKWYA